MNSLILQCGKQLYRFLHWLNHPTIAVEVIGWCLLLLMTAGARIYLSIIIPGSLWNNDSPSYAGSAWLWLDTGRWETSPVRGPIYSIFLAACLKCGGDFNTVILIQHFLGVIGVGIGLFVLRLQFGKRAFLPVMVCGYAYAVYPELLCREHYIGNESLLFFFASVSLASWFMALERQKITWLWITGIALALLTLIKNVYLPLPIAIIAGHLYVHRKRPRAAVPYVATFMAAFFLPFFGVTMAKYLLDDKKLSAPQDGLLLYGRTAQFTVLDGGIEPEIKAKIRADIETYRQLPKLNNNIILHETVVPRLGNYLINERGQTHRDMNRICRQLALEAINAHKTEYARQVFEDLRSLHLKHGTNRIRPTWKDVEKTLNFFKGWLAPHPTTKHAQVIARLEPHARKENFRGYQALTSTSWLFAGAPVLLTSLILPILAFAQKGQRKAWWMGLLAVWAFTIVLLCTVGRPLERYMTPVVPIMFWTLSSAAIYAWLWVTTFFDRHLPDQPSVPSGL